MVCQSSSTEAEGERGKGNIGTFPVAFEGSEGTACYLITRSNRERYGSHVRLQLIQICKQADEIEVQRLVSV